MTSNPAGESGQPRSGPADTIERTAPRRLPRNLAAHSASMPARCVIALLAFALLETTGCSHLFYGQCSEPSPGRLSQEPAKLSATGLFADLPSESLVEGVVAYRPQFELWSDGASKRRWIYLPPGTRIDSSDMDAWQFPEGTKFWKEFTRDGVRVETRLLHKVGPQAGDWVGVSYV